jgi:hypothetical protein
MIANIFLDNVLDQWFSQVVRQHCRGYCSIIRYADDTMVLFEREDDAHRFMRVLPLRLAKFGLTLNQTKTQPLRFGKQAAWQSAKSGNKLLTLDFLDFTHYWGRSRTGKVRLKRKTLKTRLRRALVDHYYSVPYTLVTQEVQVKVSEQLVEVFHQHQRIAAHERSRIRYRHTTVPEHMPPEHLAYKR